MKIFKDFGVTQKIIVHNIFLFLPDTTTLFMKMLVSQHHGSGRSSRRSLHDSSTTTVCMHIILSWSVAVMLIMKMVEFNWIIELVRCCVLFLVMLQCRKSNCHFNFPLWWIKYYVRCSNESSMDTPCTPPDMDIAKLTMKLSINSVLMSSLRRCTSFYIPSAMAMPGSSSRCS